MIKKVEVLKYPENLSENRFIALDFYIPENDASIEELYKSTKNAGISLINGDTSKTRKNVEKAFSNLKSTGKKVINSSIKSLKDTGKRSSLNKSALISTIYLPLPNSINDVQSNNYEESSGVVSNIFKSMNNSGALGVINELTNSMGTRNVSLNADMNSIYKGSKIRSLNLSWTFMPQNQKETNSIIQIIKTLRKYASPDATISRHFLLAPAFANVTLSNPLLNNMQRYKEMVVSEISIGLGSSGNMEMFYDGMVKEITVSISLSELKVNTRQDWEGNDKEFLDASSDKQFEVF